MRLDKFLANAGFGSRKDVKSLIKSGKVFVNNQLCLDETFKVLENDFIKCNNKEVKVENFVYYMLNKPAGYVSATQDNLYPVVTSLVDDYHQVFPVGRLDVDTVGLLLLTNDGDFAHQLTSPKKQVIKKYFVKFKGIFHDDIITSFKEGIIIDNYKCLPASFELIDDNSCYVSIKEGKFHQVKLMMKKVNLEVTYLKRVKIGNLELDESLEEGKSRRLTSEELNILKKIEGEENE